MLYGLDDTGRQVHRFNMEGFAVYVRRGAQLRRVRYCAARVLEVTTPPGVSYRQAEADAARDAAADRSGETFAQLMSKAEPP